MQLIIFILIFVFGFLTTPKTLLFYDQIEYLKIVSTHGFFRVFSLGHFPIHPFFLSIFWITSRITAANYTAFIFGTLSGILMYKISKILFKNNKYFWLTALIFLFFPGIWIINTNLMIQSVLLTFYLLSVYLFLNKKYLPFLLSNFVMIGVHVDAVYWIATIFLIPSLFKENIKISKEEFKKLIKSGILSVIFSGIFYVLIYVFIRKDFGGYSEQFFAYNSFGFLRIVRNIWFCLINNFGSLTIILLAVLLIKNIKSKKEILSWILFFALVSIGGAYWEGDLMMRRIVFAGVILSLAFFKYLGKKSIYLILFLLPITAYNAVLYYKDTVPALEKMQLRINKLPKNQILISSHYYYPFIKYDGKILWFEADNMDQVEKILQNGTRVFMTKESVTAPYLLVVGNNYHITSLNKVGNSESRNLFYKYNIIPFDDSLELKLVPQNKISKFAGEPVVFYGKGFWERLSRMRINYGDAGVWLWSIISGHKDAEGFTYKDVAGVWAWP